MVKKEVSRFIDGNIIFKECTSFSDGNKCFLIEPEGHSLIVDQQLFDQIMEKNMSPDLVAKMLQRQFAIMANKTISCNGVCSTGYPVFFMIDMTSFCNMQCKYCFRDVNNPEKYRSISDDRLREICEYILAYCKKNGIKKISIQPWGGEPLIEFKKIKDMYDFFDNTDISVHFTIETNGVLLSEKTVNWLYEHRVSIGISIDGNEKIQNMQRVLANGDVSFDKVLMGLHNVKKIYGDNFGIINTITKNSVDFVEEILDFYAKEIGIKHVKFNFVHESEFAKDLCVDSDQIQEIELRILKRIVELNEEGYEITDMNIRHKLLNLLIRDESDVCISCGCRGGREMIVFDMDGGIFPCELTDYPEEQIGSVRDSEQLITLTSNAILTHRYFADKKDEECTKCPWRYYCNGGCTIKAKLSKTKKDHVECNINKVLYPALIELILSKPLIVNKLLECEILADF